MVKNKISFLIYPPRCILHPPRSQFFWERSFFADAIASFR